MNESILTRRFLSNIGLDGLCIGVMTGIAFLIGLSYGGTLTASTMAFATLCLSRLVHGYNCKSSRPVIFRREFFNNRYLQGAFAVGFVLLNLVLLVPGSSWIVSDTDASSVAAFDGLWPGSG